MVVVAAIDFSGDRVWWWCKRMKLRVVVVAVVLVVSWSRGVVVVYKESRNQD